MKAVAIYCRVSTDNQENEGSSLDTQRVACLKYCQEHDCQATHQFIETWTGLSLERPKLDELRQLIRNKDIGGVVIYSLDRLTRDPNHGVILRQEREKHQVDLLCVTETIDSSKIGQLIQYIYDYASSLEADRLRDRMTRGIRARVFDKKLPITYREPLGYTWDKENKRLIPNSDHSTVKLILNLAIDGKSYDFIIAELKRRHIPRPSGPDSKGDITWNKHTISSIIHNPVYCGRYYAFKSEVILPKKRNGNSYGKSSVKRLPQDKWHYIPEIEIVDPPMTLEQRALLLDQLQRRQKLSPRNAKREYLLRGMIFCETHKGKNGEPRVYHGIPKHQTWYYTCPEGGCDSPYLDGETLEYVVKNSIIGPLFACRDEEFYQYLSGKDNRDKLEGGLKAELQKLEAELGQVVNKTAKLEDERISGVFTDQDVYGRLRLKYQTRRTQIKSRQDAVLAELAQLGHEWQALKSWQDIKARFLGRMQYKPETWFHAQVAGDFVEGEPKFTFDEWRELLTTLNFELHVFPREIIHSRDEFYAYMDLAKIKADLKFKAEPYPKNLQKHIQQERNRKKKPVNVVIKYSLPIKLGSIGGIALHSPEPG